MKTRLANFWEVLQSSFWFLPALMVALAIILSSVMIKLDRILQFQPSLSPVWIFSGGPEGARTLLSTIAGSMITISGVTFSITIVALTLASSQFGPRLLNNFMRDRGNQVVLGTFIATFANCLMVLRTVRGGDGTEFIPYISVTVSMLLATASMGVLIYFIHHVATSIQAENIIAGIGRELDEAIQRLFPKKTWYSSFEKQLRQEDDIPKAFENEAQPILAPQSGYLQVIDYDELMKLATENELVLRLEHRPGDFIAEGHDLLLFWPGTVPDEALVKKFTNNIIVGSQRQRTQDIEYFINQLVEIAVRALSPGINDPFTAMSCVDRLGASLIRLAERDIPTGYLYDEDNKLRLITDAVTITGIINAAFNQIRQYGRSSAAVTIRLLETIASIAVHTENRAYKVALLHQAEMILHGSETALPEEYDRQVVQSRFELVRQAVNNL